MERLAIIADNLVGANDAGVQFRKFGFSTQVVLNHLNLVNHCKGVDVISISTNSRMVSSETAYKCVYEVGNMLLNLGFQRFYKKIDSTLRGNIAEEVRAMMESLSLPLAIIAPSYPAHGRIVENGYLQLVKEWGDSSVPVPICYVPSIIKTVPSIPVAVIGLPDVRQGEQKLVQKITDLHSAGIQLITIDAVTDEDLRTIAVAINRLSVPCLAVGSAGLAGNLPIAWKVVDQEHLGLREGTMIVAGTLNQVTAEQITSVLDYPNTELIGIQSDVIYNGSGEDELERVMTEIASSLAGGRTPVVVIDTLLKDRNDIDALSLSVQVQKYGPSVTTLLGQIAKETAEKYGLRNLIIAGGGTATSICHTLEISIIDLERELLPGVPVGKVVGGSCNGLYLVTKAGGFGKKNSLRKVLEQL
ncbi:four-carbon acid sugar kinase family protein [Sporomusa sp.]|uniref:four-carbon acid sugar kinase family protein n=1 Tax=Sporomusa sp. TaxID=2078658 RepID=UPI002CA8A093|nr:four-carbon acid sugar kinase family protein [Sporomusa sp.]HWR45408.1 four-carbon acid sugar kinase family protein [Sporomusa sp.]